MPVVLEAAVVAEKPRKVEAVEVAPQVVAVVDRKDLSILTASKAATCTITRTLPASTGWCL